MKPHPDQHYGCITHAQHGDDLMILNIFALLGIDKPTYLDLGAHHPFIISNTALLYERGSRGVNVEANPNMIQVFKEWRSLDKNINVGVGLQDGEAEFYMYGPTSGRNTFSPEEVKSLQGQMTVRETKQIQVMTLDRIVSQFCGTFPHLLTIDVEGLDYDILRGADFVTRKAPILIVVETRKKETARMNTMMAAKGYTHYCRMGENIFYIANAYAPELHGGFTL